MTHLVSCPPHRYRRAAQHTGYHATPHVTPGPHRRPSTAGPGERREGQSTRESGSAGRPRRLGSAAPARARVERGPRRPPPGPEGPAEAVPSPGPADRAPRRPGLDPARNESRRRTPPPALRGPQACPPGDGGPAGGAHATPRLPGRAGPARSLRAARPGPPLRPPRDPAGPRGTEQAPGRRPRSCAGGERRAAPGPAPRSPAPRPRAPGLPRHYAPVPAAAASRARPGPPLSAPAPRPPARAPAPARGPRPAPRPALGPRRRPAARRGASGRHVYSGGASAASAGARAGGRGRSGRRARRRPHLRGLLAERRAGGRAGSRGAGAAAAAAKVCVLRGPAPLTWRSAGRSGRPPAPRPPRTLLCGRPRRALAPRGLPRSLPPARRPRRARPHPPSLRAAAPAHSREPHMPGTAARGADVRAARAQRARRARRAHKGPAPHCPRPAGRGGPHAVRGPEPGARRAAPRAAALGKRSRSPERPREGGFRGLFLTLSAEGVAGPCSVLLPYAHGQTPDSRATRRQLGTRQMRERRTRGSLSGRNSRSHRRRPSCVVQDRLGAESHYGSHVSSLTTFLRWEFARKTDQPNVLLRVSLDILCT